MTQGEDTEDPYATLDEARGEPGTRCIKCHFCVYLTLLKFVPGVEGNLKKVIPYAQQVKEMEVKIPGD